VLGLRSCVSVVLSGLGSPRRLVSSLAITARPENMSWPAVPLADTRSFDCVRLAPHFAQDDILVEKCGLENRDGSDSRSGTRSVTVPRGVTVPRTTRFPVIDDVFSRRDKSHSRLPFAHPPPFPFSRGRSGLGRWRGRRPRRRSPRVDAMRLRVLLSGLPSPSGRLVETRPG